MRIVIHNHYKTGDMPVKLSANQYRGAGEWGLWSDGLYDHITKEIVDSIRAAGFQVKRRGAQVWVRNEDMAGIMAKGIRSS